MERSKITQNFTRLAGAFALLTASGIGFGDDVEIFDLSSPDGPALPRPALFASAVPVSRVDGTNHGNDLFFALFQPDPHRRWAGNIKRYRLALHADPGTGVMIVDANGQPAIDPVTGLPYADSRDLWTPQHLAPDGADIAQGGLASRIYALQDGIPQAGSRRVYTYLGLSTELSHPSNALHEDNIADGTDPARVLSKALFDAQDLSDAAFIELIQWARGVDVDDSNGDGITTEGRMRLGAPLHTRPVSVNYGDPDSGGAQQEILFTITNSGYLHAARIDGAGATAQLEQFAFIPRDLLSNLRTLRANPRLQGDAANAPIYGLDGGLTVWVHDADGDGAITADGDHVYLYFGQRRGGRNYYALDVTDINAPRFLWQISGGSGAFSELGQSWSTAVPTRMALQLDGDPEPVARDVLVIGGGYDARHDTANQARSADGAGRALYIVDAASGDLLWWAGPSGHAAGPDLGFAAMRYAIPSPVTVVDNDGDGLSELLLVGDLGGQLWRFDAVAGTLYGGVIADLQDEGQATPGPGENRRFFEPPDVANARSAQLGDYLAIAIGSGYRAHPLDRTTEEGFFLLRHLPASGPPRNAAGQIEYTKIDAAALLDIGDRPDLKRDELNAEETARYNRGWWLPLRDTASRSFVGEKVLAPALIADGMVLFTTYTPDPNAGPADPGTGRSRLYAIQLEDGTPIEQGSETGQQKVSADDRFEDLPAGGPPAGPSVIFPPFDGAAPMVLVGTNMTGVTLKHTMLRTYWLQDHVH